MGVDRDNFDAAMGDDEVLTIEGFDFPPTIEDLESPVTREGSESPPTIDTPGPPPEIEGFEPTELEARSPKKLAFILDTCPACSAPLSPSTPAFCESCGMRLVRPKRRSAAEGAKAADEDEGEAVRCRQCGTRSGSGSGVCRNCGTRLR